MTVSADMESEVLNELYCSYFAGNADALAMVKLVA